MDLFSLLRTRSSSQQVLEVEQRTQSFEERLAKIIHSSRGLSGRTSDQRLQLIEDVTEVLEILEGAIDVLETAALVDRAKRTRTRLRTIRTNAQRAA